jgi:hypothetical protein
MTDNEGNIIEPGNVIRHSFGIPPTTVDLFVFSYDGKELHVISPKGDTCVLDEGIAASSYVKLYESIKGR